MIPIGDENHNRSGIAVITVILVLVNVVVYIYEARLAYPQLASFIRTYGMIPAEIEAGDDLYTLITSMFVHGSFLHIASNMLFLWIFGDNIEHRFGSGLFLAFYIGCGLAANAAHIMTNSGAIVPTVGASGAVSGVMGAYMVLYPLNRVRVLVGFWGYLYVPAFIFLGIWFLMQVFNGLATLGMEADMQMSGVAFWAHIGGFVTGVLVAVILRPFRAEPVPFQTDFALWQDHDQSL